MVHYGVQFSKSATTKAGKQPSERAFSSRWEGHKFPPTTSDKLFIAVPGKTVGLYRVYPYDPAEPPALWHPFQGWVLVEGFGAPVGHQIYQHEKAIPVGMMADVLSRTFDNLKLVDLEMKARGFTKQAQTQQEWP